MIQRSQNPQQFTANEPPHPARVFYFKDTYLDKEDKTDKVNQGMDATAGVTALGKAVFGFVRDVFESANIQFNPRVATGIWFNNLQNAGKTFVLNRQVSFVIEDFETYQRLHILALGWGMLTRVGERQRNFNLANYLQMNYLCNTRGKTVTVEPIDMLYSRMEPVIAGTMLADQGYATQSHLVRASRHNNGSTFVVDTESNSPLFVRFLRDKVLEKHFYDNSGNFGFGIQNLTHYGSDPLIPVYSQGVIALAQHFHLTSMRTPIDDLLSTVPISPILS